jgi:hypothetical protein
MCSLHRPFRRGVVVFEEKEAVMEDMNVLRVNPDFWSSFICISAYTHQFKPFFKKQVAF